MAEYSITIEVKESAEEAKNPVAGSEAGAVGETEVVEVGKTVAKGYGMVKRFVAPFISQLVTAHTSTISLRTGAEELQQRAQFAQSVMSQGFNIAESILIGGLTGGLPGAVFGAVMSVTQTALSYEFKQRELDMQKDAEDISLRLMSTRAGGSLAAFSGSRERSQ